jgi:hypothetical protein
MAKMAGKIKRQSAADLDPWAGVLCPLKFEVSLDFALWILKFPPVSS